MDKFTLTTLILIIIYIILILIDKIIYEGINTDDEMMKEILNEIHNYFFSLYKNMIIILISLYLFGNFLGEYLKIFLFYIFLFSIILSDIYNIGQYEQKLINYTEVPNVNFMLSIKKSINFIIIIITSLSMLILIVNKFPRIEGPENESLQQKEYM